MPEFGKRALVAGLGAFALVAGCDRQGSDGAQPVPPPAAGPPPSGPPHYIGTWAAEPELCGKAQWSIIPGALVTDSGLACDLSQAQATATGWAAQANCRNGRSGLMELNTTRSDPPTLVVSGVVSAAPVTLVKCPIAPGAEPTRDPHADLDAARAVDARIARGGPGISERRVANNALVSRIWREGGEIIKIVAPIVGGERAPGEVAYYYRPGERDPFLISGPTGSYAYHESRLVTVFSPEGAIVPELQTRQAGRQERGLLQQARTARSVAENLEAAGPRPRS